MKILVLGACNIDIIGTAKQSLLDSESNLGNINIAVGGVAKNIANNLYNLGANVSFLTLIGKDAFSIKQVQELDNIGIDYHNSIVKDVKSSIYLAVHDAQGDLNVAINDMFDFEDLKPEDFEQLDEYIKTFDVLVFDTNMSCEMLTYLITKYQDKIIYVDGVSQTKVVRLKKVIKYIDLLKINQYELNSLQTNKNYDIIIGVRELLKQGLKTCIVSHSDLPITYNIKDEIFSSETQKAKNIKSTMGAGDALFSGIIFYLTEEYNLHEAVNFGKIVASKTLEVYEACNKEIRKLINL